MNTTQIAAYVASVLLTGLTVAMALHVARRTGQKHYWAYLLFIIVNNLMAALDLVFRHFAARVAQPSLSALPVLLDMLMGFLVFPLMAVCTFAFVVFLLGLAGSGVPRLLTRVYWTYWGILFIGFILAEYRYFDSGDWLLVDILNPVFNVGILTGFLYAVLYALVLSRRVTVSGERKFVRTVALYYLLWFCLIFSFHTSQAPLRIDADVLTRSLLGLAYNLPPLLWMTARLRKLYGGPLLEPGGDKRLNHWLATQSVSPREREIIHLIVQGKDNRAIEKELFISRRTVESHLYNIYRKLGIRSRVQLVYLTAEKSREPS
jgi:DNA-binding CsgD family transcriptional regulator